MKNILILFLTLFLSTSLMAAGSDSSSDSNESMYEDGVKLVKRAGKLEKKEKTDKAKKLILKLSKNLRKHISLIKKIQIYLTIWVTLQEKQEILNKQKNFI